MMLRQGRRVAISGTLALALALLGASQAHAAITQRFASPTGSGTDCSNVAPCDIVEAVNSATPSDEVIVGPGTYNSPGNTELLITGTMNVHGALGEAIPQINFNAPPPVAVKVTGTARIARLRIDAGASNGIELDPGTTGEQLYVEAPGDGQLACSVSLALLRDSVCWGSTGTGEGVIASGDGTVTLRNVSAFGGSLALDAFAGNANEDLVVDAKNSIFGDAVTASIGAYSSGNPSSVTVNVDHSNYLSILESTGVGGVASVPGPGTGTNQDALPQFVNAANGDFHQLASSPTRNAGIADGQLGLVDFEGDARVQGSGPDIGADEFDDTAPETTIDTGPKHKSKKRKARFTFNSDDPAATFQCKLDKKAFAPCSSPKSYKKLKPGNHTFQVRGSDTIGNIEATAATYKWKVKKKHQRHHRR